MSNYESQIPFDTKKADHIDEKLARSRAIYANAAAARNMSKPKHFSPTTSSGGVSIACLKYQLELDRGGREF